MSFSLVLSLFISHFSLQLAVPQSPAPAPALAVPAVLAPPAVPPSAVLFPDHLFQQAGELSLFISVFIVSHAALIASGLSMTNPWSSAVLARADRLVEEYSSIEQLSGHTLRRVADDLRAEVMRQTHSLDVTSSYIELLKRRLATVETQLETVLVVSGSEHDSVSPLGGPVLRGDEDVAMSCVPRSPIPSDIPPVVISGADQVDGTSA